MCLRDFQIYMLWYLSLGKAIPDAFGEVRRFSENEFGQAIHRRKHDDRGRLQHPPKTAHCDCCCEGAQTDGHLRGEF